MVAQEMIVFHMGSNEWIKLGLKPATSMLPVIQGGACSVIPPKNVNSKDAFQTRKVSPTKINVTLLDVERCDQRRSLLLRWEAG